MRKFLIAICACVIFMGATFEAKAELTPIQNWDYTVSGLFTEWTNEAAGNYKYTSKVNDAGTGIVTKRVNTATNSESAWGTANNNYQSVSGRNGIEKKTYNSLGGVPGDGSVYGYNSLRWGNGTYSSIGIDGKSGSIVTDGAPSSGSGATIWHQNNAIDSTVRTLTTGVVTMFLELQAQVMFEGNLVNYGDAVTYATELEFWFMETENSGLYQDDIFIVKNPYSATTESFTGPDGVTYHFSFAASFAPLTGEYLRYAQAQIGPNFNGPLYGWVTQENGRTDILTTLTIHYDTPPPPPQTPEPATVLLLSTGLLGIWGMRKRFVK